MAFDHVSALRIHTPPDGLTVVRTSAGTRVLFNADVDCAYGAVLLRV